MKPASMKLHTEGNRIKNDAGETILLRGVNCAGLEWDAANTAVLPAVRRAVAERYAYGFSAEICVLVGGDVRIKRDTRGHLGR